VKLKSTVDTWWKIVLVTVVSAFAAFAALVVLALIIGPTPAKATADNAVKACRSATAAPRPERLDSVSPNFPDGDWTSPLEDAPGAYSMSQSVDTGLFSVGQGPTTYNPHPISSWWRCTATMAKDGMWTVTWVDSRRSVGVPWYISNSALRTIAPPRDLSGPGYGG